MKTKNAVWFFISAFLVLFISCGGSSTTPASSVTVTLVPSNSSANVAVSAAVTATFSAAITAPASWASAFTLKKNNTGETLCTVTYSSLVATCAHADLEAGSSYTIKVSGLADASGVSIAEATSTFTTVGYTPVGGTVTLQGTLSAASASVSVVKDVPSKAAVDVTSYKALALNNDTGEQKEATVAADGTFSMTLVGGSSYMINFLDSNNKYVGTLKTGEVSSDKVSTGLVTGGDGTTTALGTVTANTDSGLVTSSETLTTDSNQLASATGGVIAGGKTGEGSTDYSNTVGVTCTSGDADCTDLDHDGVPDIFDTDNDNNTYADEIDGKIDFCVPATVSLYVKNYPIAGAQQAGFPTPAEVSADLGNTTMYQIYMDLTPKSGYAIGDFSTITVSTPSYIDSYGYVYGVARGHECFASVLWKDCNGKKLLLSNDGTKYEMALADKAGNEMTPKRAGILDNMFPGDTFTYNITMADGTTHVCTRKINIIPKYYPYALKQNTVTVDTSVNVQTSWNGATTLSWSIPTQSPSGQTYAIRVVPFTSGCGWTASNYTQISAGQDVSSKVINIPTDLPTSVMSQWELQLVATDEAGDESTTGWVKFTSEAVKQCD